MRLPGYRLLMVASSGLGFAWQCTAAPPWPLTASASYPAWAFVLAALVLLFWRQRRLRCELGIFQRKLAGEYGLRANAEQTLADTRSRLCKLVASQDSLLENERRRIARDIHDDLGQNLLALKIDVSLLQTGSAGQSALAAEKLDLIVNHLDLSIKSLRSIINNLHPAALRGGLKAAIEWQLSEFSRINGIAHELDADPQLFAVSASQQVDIIVYRILQESLSNIARHARASSARVVLARAAGALHMQVSDDGVGLPADARRHGCGLQGIQDRVNAAGGKFGVASAPGQGTALSISIPLGEPAPALHHPDR